MVVNYNVFKDPVYRNGPKSGHYSKFATNSSVNMYDFCIIYDLASFRFMA